MSEEGDVTELDGPSQQEPRCVLPHDVDRLLQVLVNQARRYDEGRVVGLTLSVRGQIVTGVLVGPMSWARALKEHAPAQAAIADAWLAVFSEEAEERGDEVPDPNQVRFIHMVDTQIFTGPMRVPTSGTGVWRGRVASVDGWQLGRLSSPDDEAD